MNLRTDLRTVELSGPGCKAAEARIRAFIDECSKNGQVDKLAIIVDRRFAAQVARAIARASAAAADRAALAAAKDQMKAVIRQAVSAGVEQKNPDVRALRAMATKITSPRCIKIPDQEWYNLDLKIRQIGQRLRQLGIK